MRPADQEGSWVNFPTVEGGVRVRVLMVVVLIGLIGAGALFILSGGEQGGPELSSVTDTLKQITSRVMSASTEGEDEAAEPSGGGDLDLARWFGKGDQEATPSNKEVYYQYVDDSGTVHFVQSLGDIPAKWQSRAGRIEVEKTASAPAAGSAPRAASRRSASRKSSQRATAYRRQPEVVVYTTAWCGWCQKTLQFLDERGVRYVNKDIEANDWNRDELIEKTGRTSIPVVEIDGEIIRGFNAGRMEQLLARSG
jgi:glutaredoxin